MRPQHMPVTVTSMFDTGWQPQLPNMYEFRSSYLPEVLSKCTAAAAMAPAASIL